MIVNLCDACGRKTSAGANLRDRRIRLTPETQTKRHARDHTPSRSIRVRVQFGIDDLDPETEHPGHDLCDACRVQVLRAVIERLEESA